MNEIIRESIEVSLFKEERNREEIKSGIAYLIGDIDRQSKHLTGRFKDLQSSDNRIAEYRKCLNES